MNLKRIIGSHFANYREAWEANRLVAAGKGHPTLSKVYPLAETGQAVLDVHSNAHQGGRRALTAPHEGLGVSLPAPGTARGADQPIPEGLNAAPRHLHHMSRPPLTEITLPVM